MSSISSEIYLVKFERRNSEIQRIHIFSKFGKDLKF